MQGLSATVEGMLQEVRQKWQDSQQQAGALDSFRAFTAAVDWTEPWLTALLIAEAALLLSVVALRRRSGFLGTVLICSGGLIYFLEPLNSLAREHWRSFSKQNYFDPQGIFLGAVVAAPLLLIMFFALVSFLVDTCRLLVNMKRKEILHKARQRRAAAAARQDGAPEIKKDI